MGGIWTAQTNFTKGELDPQLVGRIDLQAYYQSVKEATNVVALPQGGLRKRGGLAFLGEALGEGRLEQFSFNVEQNYLFVFTNLRLQIYRDGVILDPIDAGNNFLVTPWTCNLSIFCCKTLANPDLSFAELSTHTIWLPSNILVIASDEFFMIFKTTYLLSLLDFLVCVPIVFCCTLLSP